MLDLARTKDQSFYDNLEYVVDNWITRLKPGENEMGANSICNSVKALSYSGHQYSILLCVLTY